jgi:imidazolonepropionase-like amidohydrolase
MVQANTRSGFSRRFRPASTFMTLVSTRALLLGIGLIPSIAASEHADVLVRNATVVDVIEGRLLEKQDIAVRDGRVVAIQTAAASSAWEAQETVDAAGKFAIPGLWDMHVHFGGGEALIEDNRNLLPLYVAHGVTAVRDAAGDLSASVLQWRAEIAAGKTLGPMIFTSGPKIEGRGSIWPGDTEVGTLDEIVAALERLREAKADFVKITDDKLSPELFMVALAEARKRGFRTSAHIPMAITIEEASAAGLSSIEHMAYAYKAGSTKEREIAQRFRAGELTSQQAWAQLEATFDRATAAAAYARLAAHGTAVTPTLNGSRVIAYLDQDDHRDDEYLKYIGPGLQATYAWRVERAAKEDAAAIRRRHERYERIASVLPLLQEAGVKILAGTDAGFLNSFNYPGVGLHEELAVFVRTGLTPLQALRAATINGAEFMQRADVSGSIAVGKVADVVLLDANPLQSIDATRRIDAVILRGRLYSRDELDRMLRDAAERVAAQARPQR